MLRVQAEAEQFDRVDVEVAVVVGELRARRDISPINNREKNDNSNHNNNMNNDNNNVNIILYVLFV